MSLELKYPMLWKLYPSAPAEGFVDQKNQGHPFR